MQCTVPCIWRVVVTNIYPRVSIRSIFYKDKWEERLCMQAKWCFREHKLHSTTQDHTLARWGCRAMKSLHCIRIGLWWAGTAQNVDCKPTCIMTENLMNPVWGEECDDKKSFKINGWTRIRKSHHGWATGHAIYGRMPYSIRVKCVQSWIKVSSLDIPWCLAFKAT